MYNKKSLKIESLFRFNINPATTSTNYTYCESNVSLMNSQKEIECYTRYNVYACVILKVTSINDF